MKIFEKGMIDATPDKVWPYVSDPHLMSDWNKKLVAINRDKRGEVIAGEKFKVRYRMSNKETESEVTVTNCESPLHIEYHHLFFTTGKKYEATESYELKTLGEKTQFRQIINLGKAIPWWAKPIVWFLNRFGESQGKENAEKIAELIAAE